MRTVHVTQFDGGITSDPRDPRINTCRTCQHFDLFTNKYKLTPYRSAESGDSAADTHKIANYVYAGGTLYGLGLRSSVSPLQPSIWTKTDLTNSTWTELQSVAGTNRADADIPFFTYYKATGKLYGVRAGQYVWSVDPAAPSANNTEHDLTAYTTVSNGLVHSKDDILYVGYDNKIASNNAGTWTVPALTLPSDYIITSICEYGNYLAIGARSNTGRNAKVWLWDRDSSLTTLSESIDWGIGDLYVLEELEGYLIGVSYVGTTGSYALKARMECKYYNGSGGAVKFAELVGSSTTPTVQGVPYKSKVFNRIFFPASMPIDSTAHFGIWSIGRSSTGVPFALTLDRLFLTAFSGGLTFYGLITLGDYLFASYLVGSSPTFYMDKTNDAATYTTASVYESTINPDLPPGDRPLQKKLLAAAISMEPLTSGQQLVLKYRVDGGAWVTVLTASNAGTVVQEQRNTSSAEFVAGREYEFRVESTGGAEFTGLHYKYEAIPTLL